MRNEEQKKDLYNKFIKWKSRPIPKNTSPLFKDFPKTIAEFCEKNLCTNDDIKEIISASTYEDDLVNESLVWARSETPNVLHLVYSQLISQKDVNSLEKFFNILYDLKKRKEDQRSNISQINFFNLDDDKFAAIATRVARKTGFLAEGSKE